MSYYVESKGMHGWTGVGGPYATRKAADSAAKSIRSRRTTKRGTVRVVSRQTTRTAAPRKSASPRTNSGGFNVFGIRR